MKPQTTETDRAGCAARRYGDQMQCARCGLAYDVDDPDPPACLTDKEINHRKGRETLDRIKNEVLKP